MKKLIAIMMVLALGAALLVGCGQKEETPAPSGDGATSGTEAPANGEAAYEDGVYFAATEEFPADNAWKGAVTVVVEGGKIVSADFNGINKNGGPTKKEVSAAGNYPMVERGGAIAEYHEQAALAEAYLVETQDPTQINYTGEDGVTDAISGVTIKVQEYFELAQKALAAGPIIVGPYKDGGYQAEEAAFTNGWKYNVGLTVLNGNIVAVSWNGSNEEDPEQTKKQASMDGNYPMVEQGGAIADWHVQAAEVEKHLLETQDPTDINYTGEDGVTDAISGVTIKVKAFFTLAEEALKGAR
ncbi:FMN-binding protein [Anaerotalea alkaliphila]|uniref:FMN-binding protein n=1 Tax=Anaerotalea alkaliphila TaxID=2662126 RepID=A0A7X5HTV2_9FIRM|nr:FMN-binding protein [Anaerotalea alkaliphila]NDL66562.1 FMN-binding protein [Anaerotalea alkaliphila]